MAILAGAPEGSPGNPGPLRARGHGAKQPVFRIEGAARDESCAHGSRLITER